MIQLVFAHNGYNFGADDGMPWPHISQDFKNFKERTYHTTLIMGAKTFESLPCLLAGRQHFVVVDPTRGNPVAKNGDVAHKYISINEFERILRNNVDTSRVISVIGGVKLLGTALHYANKVIKTNIDLLPDYFRDGGKVPTQFLTSEFLGLIESSSRFTLSESNHTVLDKNDGGVVSITEQVFNRLRPL